MDTRGTNAQAANPQVNPYFWALVSPQAAEPGIINHRDRVTVRLDRRTYSPVLRSADIPDTTVPWWDDRTLHFEYA